MLLIAMARMLALAGALPLSFIIDLGSVSDDFTKTSITLLSGTLSLAPESIAPPTFTAVQTEHATAYSATTVRAEPTFTTTITISNSSLLYPPSSIPSTLPPPTPTNDTRQEHNTSTSTPPLSATPTSPPTPTTNSWSWWTTPTTFALIFYDLTAFAVLFWLWMCGYLSWSRCRRSRNTIPENTAREMLGLRLRRGEMWEWSAGSGSGSQRTESQERRRGEIEGEMRRLGMI